MRPNRPDYPRGLTGDNIVPTSSQTASIVLGAAGGEEFVKNGGGFDGAWIGMRVCTDHGDIAVTVPFTSLTS